MMRRTLVGAVVLVLATTPASAQFAVIDPANLAQAILIVQRTQRHLEELRAQYRTIVQMAQGLGRMDQYRTPPSVLTRHDVSGSRRSIAATRPGPPIWPLPHRWLRRTYQPGCQPQLEGRSSASTQPSKSPTRWR